MNNVGYNTFASAVFVTISDYWGPDKYPLGNLFKPLGGSQAHPRFGETVVGSEKPVGGSHLHTAGSEVRSHGTGGGFYFFPADIATTPLRNRNSLPNQRFRHLHPPQITKLIASTFTLDSPFTLPGIPPFCLENCVFFEQPH